MDLSNSIRSARSCRWRCRLCARARAATGHISTAPRAAARPGPLNSWRYLMCARRVAAVSSRVTGALGHDAVLKRGHDVVEGRRLFPEWKAAGAVDQMELRGALLLRDDVEQHQAGFLRRKRIVACPDDLGRHLDAFVAAGLPHAVARPANAGGKAAGAVPIHGRGCPSMRCAGRSFNASVEQTVIDVSLGVG